MQPYKPLLLNDKNEKGISNGNYMQILQGNPQSQISKSVDTKQYHQLVRPTEDSIKSQINPSYINQLIIENQVLNAKLKEEQNKAQYATNKYLYQQMMYKKMEYEKLIKKLEHKQKLPQINSQRIPPKQKTKETEKEFQFVEPLIESQINFADETLSRRRALSIAPSINHEETPRVYKVKQIKNKKVLSFTEVFEEVQKMKEKQRLEQEKKERGALLWKKFLRCYLIIQIVITWSKKIRDKRKIKQQKQEQQNNKAKGLFRAIKKVDEKQQHLIAINWVKSILDDIFVAMKGEEMKKIFSLNFNQKQLESKELQRKWITYFSIKFFQNLEQQTKVNVFPDFLCYQMTLQLYRYQEKEVGLFVACRTPYLSANVFQLTQKEMNLIVCEFILFRILIPTMITVEQEQKYFNSAHMAQCRYILFLIMSVLQIVFVEFFEKMEQKRITGKLNVVQKRILIHSETTFELKFTVDNQIDETQNIISGLEKKQMITKRKLMLPEIFSDLTSFLELIIDNLSGSILT